MRFEPVRTVRAYERIVEQIEEAVERGDLRPGERLPSERELMVQFSVSRSTVREALRVLQARGLVRSRPGDPNGAEVQPFTPAALHKSMTTLARVDELSIGELVQFRMVLDSAANLLAARLKTPEQLAEMEAAIAAMRASADQGYETFSAADVAFHDAVARASGNKLIEICNDVVRSIVLNLVAGKLADAPELMERSVRHHEEVLEAVRQGDGQSAARLARQTMYDYYETYVPEAQRDALRALLE
ncbi:FadR/GntR family transcriptional regulator [Nonomuraea sp. NPDC050556]|uniref:FadR/GntR family transcriptional regulator n=1 Tax=Nonomuraea sp. NPDC050556 TaxID=3364369 RepID=UPI003795BA88